MKRMTIIAGLFLIGLLLSSSLWPGLTGARAAAANEAQPASGGGMEAAPPAQITLVPFAPAVGPAQLATIAARLAADAVVAVDDLNLRSGPGLRFSVLGNYLVGTPLKILGQGRDSSSMPWLYVQTPDGKKGWMSARPSFQRTEYIQINVPVSDIPFVTPPTPTPIPVDGYVAVDDLNMRSGPGLGHNKIGKYDRGTPFDILGQSPDRDGMPWLYVQTPDGKKGFMSARPSLRTTPYVQINIPFSQIRPLSETEAGIEIEEVVMDTPVRARIAPIGPKFWLYRLSAVSCSDVCAPFISGQSQLSGNEVCLEWFEMGTPDSNERIRIDIRRNGTSLGTGSVLAEGDKLCRPIRLTLPDDGDYEAVISTNRSEYDHVWSVD